MDTSNWSRWGDDDERGTLNLINEPEVQKASTLIRSGRVYRLAVPIRHEHSSPFREGALHISSIRNDDTATRRQVAIDVIAMHTHDFTHIDALAHVGYDGYLYNGFPTDTVGYGGAQHGGIDNAIAIVGRAIIADLPRVMNVSDLGAGFPIQVSDLETALESVSIMPGDILLVRTGWMANYLTDRSIAKTGWPGLSPSTVDWLHDKDIVAVGADNISVEVMPYEDSNASMRFHERYIRDVGGYLLEFLMLDELCRDQISEAFFVTAPLNLHGGLGSPVSPLAIV